jgi:exonuclease SbcC
MTEVMGMRPKILEIEGLQSFKDTQRIDFETLSETGLFGIFGPTGSGKSTILDAITFALYGRVERAKGTQGIIHANLNNVRVSFTFELKKAGQTKEYRVERVYRRKKDTAACEPRIARLIEITGAGDIPLSDKANDVSAKVEELIGLNLDDFTRAVVLPQNKFQEFLMLDTSKRREMLERIFYLEEYGQQLTDRVKKKMDSLNKRLELARGVLSELGDASDEAVEESVRHLNAALEDRKNADKNLKRMEARYNEAKELWQLMQDLEHLLQQERVHAAGKEEMDAKKAALQKALKAEELISLIQNHRDTAKLLEATIAELSKAEAQLPALAEKLSKIQKEQEENRTNAEKQRPVLLERQTRLNDARSMVVQTAEFKRKIKSIADRIAAANLETQNKDRLIQQKRSELAQTEMKLTEIRSELNALKVDPDYRQAMQSGAALQKERQTAEKESVSCFERRKQLQDRTSKLADQEKGFLRQAEIAKQELLSLTAERDKLEQAKPGDRNACIQRNRELNELQILSIEIKRAAQDLVALKKKETEVLDSRKEIENNRQETAIRLETAKEAAEACRQLAADREIAMDQHAAYLLSRKLTEGAPCPVCGSLHHPQHAEITGDLDIVTAEQEIAAAKEQFAEAEEGMRAIEKELLILEEQIRNQDTGLKQVQSDILKAEGICHEKAANLPNDLQALLLQGSQTQLSHDLQILASPGSQALLPHDKLQAYIREQQNRVNDMLKAIDAWETSLRTLQDQFNVKNEALSEISKKLGSVTAERRVNEENLLQAAKDEEEARRKWNEKQEAFVQFLQTWTVQDPSDELIQIADKDRKSHSLSMRADQLQQAQQTGREALDKLSEERSELAKQTASLETEGKSTQQQCAELEEKIRQIAPDGKIQEEIRRIDAQLADFAQVENKYKEMFEDLQAQYQQQVTRQSTLKNQQDIYSGSYDREETELTNARSARGFYSDQEAEDAVLSKHQQQLLDRQLQEYQKKADNLQGQRQVLEGKRKDRSITEEEWNEISDLYREAAEQKETSIARYEVEKNKYEALIQKHERWVYWNSTQTELAGKAGLLEQIQKLLKGDKGKDNSFVDYIAEERLRYVAAKASEILGYITRYKYALELDINEGFIIRDNGNGGISRMVSSLSGGETFLTSLSLALALSEQIQLKGQSPLEFFFLDEGFGTLDNQLLDTVIDSLERLSTKERVVGLISHVPELKNRITRRLIVDPPTSQGDGSRVTIEKA